MISVNMHEAKSRLSELVRQVQEESAVVLVCRNGEPVAELRKPSRPPARNRLTPHPKLSKVILHYDPAEPLSLDEWPEDSR